MIVNKNNIRDRIDDRTICPICKKHIDKTDEFIYSNNTILYGIPFIYHKKCVKLRSK